MDRSTIEVVLPQSGAKVVMYEYMTTGDKRKIRRSMMAGMKVSVEGSKTSVGDISGEVMADMEEVALSCLIKEIISKDGVAVTDVQGFVYGLPSSDGDMLYEKVNEINAGSELSGSEKKN